MALNINPRAYQNVDGTLRNAPKQQNNGSKTTPMFTPDPEHCAVEHEADMVYDKVDDNGKTLENLDDIRYSQNAKRAFIYSEIFGRPLSQRRRT